MPPHDNEPSAVYGLAYPPAFLDALPVLAPRGPVRSLNAPQFADLHLAHLTSHAPDSVLFPFLHGLEGTNDAQNAFFAASRPRGDVPRFRGLVWVACDEDDGADLDELEDDDEDDDAYSSSSLDSFGPTELDDDVAMDLDPSIEGPMVTGCPPPALLDTDAAPEKLPTAPPPPPAMLTAGHLPSSASVPRTKFSTLTSSFRPRDLLRSRAEADGSTSHVFVDPKIPDGISLRNFGIQTPIYATLSDIVVYSPRGNTKAAQAAAERFQQAVESKYQERKARCSDPDSLLVYNVFVLDASASEMERSVPHLLVRIEDAFVSEAHTDGTDAHTQGENSNAESERLLRANTIDFAQREKDEMRDLTQASEIATIVDPASGMDPTIVAGSTTSSYWDPALGQIFLGNSNDVPLPPDRRVRMRTLRGDEEDEDVFDWQSNDPSQGYGYDLCIECHDYAPFPSSAHLRAVEEHVRVLEKRWIEKCVAEMDGRDGKDIIPPRPPPSASHVAHLPFPSSPASSVVTLNALLPFIAFLERLIQPPSGAALTFEVASEQLNPGRHENGFGNTQRGARRGSTPGFAPSSLPPPSSFPPSFFPPTTNSPSSAYTRVRSTSATYLPSSASSPSSSPLAASPVSGLPIPMRTRPVKILIYSADGYTESSVLALSTLMALRSETLPEAYLSLQVEKKRSFFVYHSDLGVLRRVEAKLEKERKERAHSQTLPAPPAPSPDRDATPTPAKPNPAQNWVRTLNHSKSESFGSQPVLDGEADNVVAHNQGVVRTMSESAGSMAQAVVQGRPRASTMPPTSVSPWSDHQIWFNDPRFDGSFPSRVLPFLYLGNLNHASNAFMLHALGITHVVSVGECALVPPPHLVEGANGCTASGSGAHFVPGKGPGGQGSLWIEEREGRIKVLDIKGVCDDGIDTLEPQLEPICEWIDRARAEGGKVLVHCRVGVSRSATVTIAYVMKHLALPLVDAYLIVRSRRLSVLIQPNMRLLYNLLGWEVKLARERALRTLQQEGGADAPEEVQNEKMKAHLRNELARALNWPYLAKEVHALNEKYLH